MSDASSKYWHLAQADKKLGEFTSQQLAEMGKAGKITSDMLVWRDGMDKWQPVSKMKGLTVTPLPPAAPRSTQKPSVAGAPVPAPALQPVPISGHVTVEKTRKSLKLHQLLSLLCIVIGFCTVAIASSLRKPGSTEMGVGVPVGGFMFIGGLVWRGVTNVRVWWHHG